jgi:hypothetical protein
MRNWGFYLVFLLLISAPCLGQGASGSGNPNSTGNGNASPAACKDCRPFGKYLAELCTISSETPTLASQRRVTCTVLDYPEAAPPNPQFSAISRKDQTIAIKLVCDPTKKTDCDPPGPKIGSDFFVSAKADSGLPVRQTVLQGSVTPLGGNGTVEYRTNGPGPIIIRATVQATPLYTAAAPVDLILQASTDASASASCALIPASPVTSTPLDAPTIVTLLGNPTPFILSALGPNTIAIYSTREQLRTIPPAPVNELRILRSFQGAIAALAGRTATSLGITIAPAKPFSVELKIPHASALSDLATRIGTLNYSQFTVQDVGKTSIRVTAPTPPECGAWKGFLTDIREMAWQLVPVQMSNKLYYLSSSDVATAFSGLAPAAAPAAPAAAATTGSSTATPAAGSAPSASPSAAPSGTSSSAASAPAAGAASTPSGAVSSSATIAINQPPGSNIQINSDTTPCVVAGLAFGNATGCGSAPAAAATTAPAPAATPAAPSTLAMASMAVASGTGEQTPPDILVYSDTNPGDDAQIMERDRVLAQLDLPRPEMILNAWVTQNSSASPQAIGAFNNMVKGLVADYDREFESVVLRGWESVKGQLSAPNYFNEPFRSYIADRFVADTSVTPKPGNGVQELSQAFLDSSQATMADPVYPAKRTDLGICERKRYCLGYNTLFNPLKPALTDLLLAIIAAQEPIAVADTAIRDVEGPTLLATNENNICGAPTRDYQASEIRKRCRAIWSNLDLDHATPPPQPPSCEERDFRGILGSLFNLQAPEPRVHLQCFREQAFLLFRSQPASGGTGPYGVGLLRAALADFLFTYKMSQQYPHEFTPYDLTQSANALNYALSPLIDAFNRDLWSYQLFMRADMQYRAERLNMRMDDRCCVKRLFGLDKPSFFNDGLVTVRTISGQATSVSTTSQSFLNGSTAPELSNVLNSLVAPSSTTTTTTTIPPGFPLSGYAGIAAAIANYQTSFAQIGRQLSFTATPRSLATASSAEISVTLNADESAGGPLYTGPGANDPAFNTSRVANHDTTTRVRVDSIKLFEVSSFSAIVERSRSRFPLLPPFVEIPYIGTFAGIPLGAAREFHSSTAIISAYVVPTAADIAYGLRFVSDLVVDGANSGRCSFFKGAAGPDVGNACVFRKGLSLHDFAGQPIREFNRNIIRCFATNTTATDCGRVSFDNAVKIQ